MWSSLYSGYSSAIACLLATYSSASVVPSAVASAKHRTLVPRGLCFVQTSAWTLPGLAQTRRTHSLIKRGQGGSLALLSCLSPVEEQAPSLQAGLVNGIHFQGHVFLEPNLALTVRWPCPVSLDSSGAASFLSE
ncbi:unnamed protein product [Rangifer tarandus platyrhynchus]|uniref:Uncharacterized protein n=1 Tax=Rangifer tarandus platyrhynchus TaxID=3082113 RepID=A0AC59ZP08_RANTA